MYNILLARRNLLTSGRALTKCTRTEERRQWLHLRFSMENCLELAIRTEGAVGSVAPTIEQGIVLAIHLPNAMAQAELDILLNKLSGRLTGDSKFYTTHRYGKTVVSNYPLHRDPKKVTAQQQAQSDTFGKAVKLCKAEMNNPERLAFWQEQYNQYVKLANKSLSRANAQFFGIDPNTTPQSKQKYYSTLRGFIIVQLTKQLKEGNNL